jgi:hypothetical protein
LRSRQGRGEADSLKEKEPKIVRVESPGKGFYEQVEVDGRSLYVVYNHPSTLKSALNKRLAAQGKDTFPEESISTEQFMPGDSGEDVIIHNVPLKRCPWPLSGLPEDPGDELMEEVKAFVMRHVDLPDERLYDVVAAWVFVSWLPEAFNAVPYLWIMGPKSSGKTRLLEVLQHLCYRAMLAAHISDAALFRAIEAYHPTLLLDEASEVYNGEAAGVIQNLLNSGYRRSQYVVRVGGVESGEPKLELFDVYGPKAMAGLGGFKETLESRSILILMEKNVRGIEFTVDVDVAKKLRGRLLMWRFRRLSDISAVSDVALREIPKELSFCDGRFAELYTPLILVANDGVESIVSSAKDAYESVMDEEKISVEAQILTAILKTKPYLESGKFPTSVVTEKFNEELSEREKWGNRSIGRLLKRLGFRAKRLTGGSRGWVWEEERIMRLTKRYGTPPVATSLTPLTSLDKALENPLQPESTVEVTGNGVPVIPSENPPETSLTSPSLFEMVEKVSEALRCAGQSGLRVDDVAMGLGLLSSEAKRLLETVQRDGHAFVVPGGRWRWVP